MTERALLALAAKAAGLGLPQENDTDDIGRQYVPTLGLWVRFPWGWDWFAPHYSDSDAFRLAADLQIDYEVHDELVIAWARSRKTRCVIDSIKVLCNGDPRSAARTAIVRAAAAIGQAMP